MQDPARMLRDFSPSHGFFIGFDSDGCVFDTMELKQKECFCPAFINVFGLQPVSRYAREVWEFVNLYSGTRGVNRFIALLHAVELLDGRPEVKARRVSVPALPGLHGWVARETKLSNGALKKELERTGDPDLRAALRWSEDVNTAVELIARNVPPFPFVVETLENLQGRADVLVVSQTPVEAIEREWGQNGIAEFVRLIAGQEMGTKTEHLALAAGGKYRPERILMVGDAPGDSAAAAANQALFFPIIPQREEASWERLHGEGLEKFFDGSFAGAYQDLLLEEFRASLPDRAPWEV